jgi:hypothetical protein
MVLFLYLAACLPGTKEPRLSSVCGTPYNFISVLLLSVKRSGLIWILDDIACQIENLLRLVDDGSVTCGSDTRKSNATFSGPSQPWRFPRDDHSSIFP